MITISAFKWVPEFAQGQVRDLRARWALEEAGLPYKTRLLELGDQDKSDYRALTAVRAGADPRGRRHRAVRIRGHRAAYRRTERDAAAEGRERTRTRDAMADRGAQFHRAVRHERRPDRSLLPERGMGEAAPPGGGGVRAEAPVRALQVARRQALPRWRP